MITPRQMTADSDGLEVGSAHWERARLECPDTEPLRVLLLASGSSTHTIKWANALSRHGIEVHIAYCGGHDNLIQELDSALVLHSLPIRAPFGYIGNLLPLRFLIKRLRPSIVHAHYASGYGTLLRFLGRRPSILSAWGSDVFLVPERNWLARRVVRKNLQAASVVCSTSEVMASRVAEIANDGEMRIEVVPFGVDLECFRPVKFHEARPGITFGVVKSFKPLYGIDVIIRAFAAAQTDLEALGCGPAKLVLVGDGPQRLELENLVVELGIQDQVLFAGAVPNADIPALLSSFDIFVQASYTESFGVAIIEAAACGIPVIATNAPGFVEVLGGGKFGLLVSRGNVEEMASAMIALGSDSRARTRLAASGRTHVEEQYDFKENVRSMISIYRQLGEGGA